MDLMESEEWKSGGEEVFRIVSEWGKEVLGADYTLVRKGAIGPHCLLSEGPQRLHLDSVFPFFSGPYNPNNPNNPTILYYTKTLIITLIITLITLITLDSHTIACLV